MNYNSIKANRFNNKFLYFAFCMIALGSCVNPKKIIYFQGSEPITMVDSTKIPKIIYSAGDILSITVSSLDQEAVKPFNLSVPSETAANKQMQGYLIDEMGNINFPVIGKIKIAELQRSEAIDLITLKLKDYIVNPIVDIQLTNFRVTFLGDIANPGVKEFTANKVNIIEAIGVAGDLNVTGVRSNILVIREVNGKKEEIRVPINSKDIFNSPAYYLCKNDIIYVEPNNAAMFRGS